jgi:hypothetical protein
LWGYFSESRKIKDRHCPSGISLLFLFSLLESI